MTEQLMIVYFGKIETVPDLPNFNEEDFLGFRLWKPNGKAVYLWAIDYVVCQDERFIVFGPYESVQTARAAFEMLPRNATLGFRVVPRHCYEWEHKEKSFPHHMWTDG